MKTKGQLAILVEVRVRYYFETQNSNPAPSFSIPPCAMKTEHLCALVSA